MLVMEYRLSGIFILGIAEVFAIAWYTNRNRHRFNESIVYSWPRDHPTPRSYRMLFLEILWHHSLNDPDLRGCKIKFTHVRVISHNFLYYIDTAMLNAR